MTYKALRLSCHLLSRSDLIYQVRYNVHRCVQLTQAGGSGLRTMTLEICSVLQKFTYLPLPFRSLLKYGLFPLPISLVLGNWPEASYMIGKCSINDLFPF